MKRLITELDRSLVANHSCDNALFQRLIELQHKHGILHGNRPISPFLRPFFMERSMYESIRQAARCLGSALEKLTHAALSDDGIMAVLGLTEAEQRWARQETGYKCVSVNSRLDTFIHQDRFAFLEYNGENPAGIGDQHSLDLLYQEVPEVNDFLTANPHYVPQPHLALYNALTATYREFGGKKQRPSIAIVDWEDVSTASEFLILKEFFESKGHACQICDPTELEFDGSALRCGSFEIDIFFKRVIIHEFLARFDETHPLFSAITNGGVCMANSFRSKIPHKKSSFAILSDEKYRHLFDRDEGECIDEHIPWTRRLTEGLTSYRGNEIDVTEFVRRERATLVLKPNDDYGGKGIFIGWESSPSEWDDAISLALNDHYVVQERVPVLKTDMPIYRDGSASMEALLVDFDPFLFRGEVEGGMVRLSSKSLVNVTQGGTETGLVILEGC